MKSRRLIKHNPFAVIFLLLLIVMCFIVYKLDITIGILFSVTFIILAVLWIIWTLRSYKNTEHALNIYNKNLTYNKKSKDGKICNPFPVIVTDGKGEIEWFNVAFDEIGPDFSNFSGYNISELQGFGAIDKENFGSEKKCLTGENKKYTVYPSQLENGFTAWFFVDDTYYKNTETEFLETRPVVLFIAVDSLESSEETLKHIDYTSVVSQIESTVSRWLAAYNCTFRKYAEGKFFALTELKNYDRMSKDGFTVLDETRTLNDSTDAEEITLTIGIGKGKDFTSSEKAAKEAINLARGRGGDQVVSKIDGEFSTFGGKTLIKERLSRVQAKQQANLLDDKISASENIYIMGHAYSDYDALGASVAVAEICKAAGKKVCIYFNKKTSLANALYNYVIANGCDTVFIEHDLFPPSHFENSLLIVVDTNRPELVDCPSLLKKCTQVAVVDHHRVTPASTIENSCFIHDPNASSACELAAELVEYSKFSPAISPCIATALLCGIILDTRNYSLRSGIRTFETAAYLKSKLASTTDARRIFAGTKKQTSDMAVILSDADFRNGYAVSFCNTDDADTRIVCSKAADELLNINNIDAAYVIYKSGGRTMISARSLGRTNVQTVMEKFGGGGHSNMAACQLGDMTFEDAKNKLIKIIEDSDNK